MRQIKIFCPATVANLSCGFDVLGVCLDTIGDEMTITKTDEIGIRIIGIEGADLPLETENNVAGVAALAMLKHWQCEYGFEISINKKIKAGSGIGSSAASAAGAVFGINELLGRPFEKRDLVGFAAQGEKLASGSAHADNVAPALFGGFTLVRGYSPLDIVRIESPDELYFVIIHPQIEIRTADARAIIPKTVALEKAIRQWGNLGGFVAGLYTDDYELIARSIQDVIVEPFRSTLIAGFDDVRNAAMQSNALGCGIAGSGPSIFSICRGSASAELVAESMQMVYRKMEIPFNVHVSKVNSDGIRILEQR